MTEPPETTDWWQRLYQDVIEPELCTQCGSCVGLSDGLLEFTELCGVPQPQRTAKAGAVPEAAYRGCPARFCSYPDLCDLVFGKLPTNWLAGIVEASYVGHAADEVVRRAGASGGVITAILIHLLETGAIKGVVSIRLGQTVPWAAEPIIARSRDEVLACAQSVYSVTPVNTILGALEQEDGPLAYVGLPDQVASIRKLQIGGHPSVRNIRYVFGPYMGTQMYFEAIRSFLRSNGVRSESEILKLRYRAGEWPGYLEIHLRDGRVLRAEKFHYNYLIPFFVTRSSLQLVDFTNELTDISVGDAWSPQYEAKRGGYSVVLVRTGAGRRIIDDMREKNLLSLEEIAMSAALDMHGHMLDFKKRGSFIRIGWQNRPPQYGYRPARIPASRIAVEHILAIFFAIGRMRLARFALEHIPLSVVGPVFDLIRRSWKSISKPTKRKGLREMKFVIDRPVDRP